MSKPSGCAMPLIRMSKFEIKDVTKLFAVGEETLGSKAKEWLVTEVGSDDMLLWKACRKDVGDDWPEKIAERLANLIRLPHAHVELATRRGERGVVVRDFRVLDGMRIGDFVPGNELMWKADAAYPKGQKRKSLAYTVERSMRTLHELGAQHPQTGVQWGEKLLAEECFVGDLLFDAWISNQDRHHENWGVLRRLPTTFHAGLIMSPSFDHASSLAHNETDSKRAFRLETKDSKASIEVWSKKAMSPFFAEGPNTRQITTMEALAAAAAISPAAFSRWRERLAAVEEAQVVAEIEALPDEYLSPVGRRFTLTLLDLNRRAILSLATP